MDGLGAMNGRINESIDFGVKEFKERIHWMRLWVDNLVYEFTYNDEYEND